jgi:hypothetical protein
LAGRRSVTSPPRSGGLRRWVKVLGRGSVSMCVGTERAPRGWRYHGSPPPRGARAPLTRVARAVTVIRVTLSTTVVVKVTSILGGRGAGRFDVHVTSEPTWTSSQPFLVHNANRRPRRERMTSERHEQPTLLPTIAAASRKRTSSAGETRMLWRDVFVPAAMSAGRIVGPREYPSLWSYEGGATEVVRRAWSAARNWRATAALGSGLVASGVEVGGAGGVRRNPAKVRIAGSVAICRLSTVMAGEVRRRSAVRRGDHPAG